MLFKNRNTNLKVILIGILILQFVFCLFTPAEVDVGLFGPLTLFLVFISIALWLEIIPSIKYAEQLEEVEEASPEHFKRAVKIIMNNSKDAWEQRVKMSTIAAAVFAGIALLAFICVFFIYFFKYYIWIKHYFFKFTRILGVIIFLVCIGLFIALIRVKRNEYKNMKATLLGLIIQNILCSMMLFIY